MLLQLITLGFAANASSEASDAAESGRKTLDAVNGNRTGGDKFLTFEDLDYKYVRHDENFFRDVRIDLFDEKVFTKTSIPINSIKNITELHSDNLGEENFLTSQRNRIREKHKGKFLLILTFTKECYYLDCTMEEFQKKIEKLL
jgi:hypothetical protein